MYNVVKRDGQIVSFDINKIADAIKKAFEAPIQSMNSEQQLRDGEKQIADRP